MIAVVTGSSGFIGSHLVDALLEQGTTVRALVRPESRGARNPKVAYWTVDPLDDRSVRESAAWKGVTHVYHVAGVTKRRTLSEFRYGNVVPTANLLSAAAGQELRLRRFVFVSSQAAAGPANDATSPVREEDAARPIEAYGQSKLEAEEATRRYAKSIPVTIVRPGAVYGPRDVDFLNVFREARRRIAFHAAPRTQAMSLVYVRDLVQALIMAADCQAAEGRTYFAAGDQAVTWSDIYQAVARQAGSSPIEIQLPAPALALAGKAGNLLSLLTGRHFLMNTNKVALSRPRWWLCDSSRARRELGWTATTTLDDGLLETYQWYVKEGWLK